MDQTEYENIDIKRPLLSSNEIIEIINNNNQDTFKFSDNTMTAISKIVIAVNNCYLNSDIPIYGLMINLREIIHSSSLENFQHLINKSDLAKNSLDLQILFLLQSITFNRMHSNQLKKAFWLAISLHTAILLKRLNKQTFANNILMQFKLAIFSRSNRRIWLWDKLPDISLMYVNAETIVSIFNDIELSIHQGAVENKNLQSNQYIQISQTNTDGDVYFQLSQIGKIITALEIAHYHKASKTQAKFNNHSKQLRLRLSKLIKNNSTYNADYDLGPYHWDTSTTDIERKATTIETVLLRVDEEHPKSLEKGFEEILDNVSESYVGYKELADPEIRQSAPQQTIDLSLQQNYMSQRNLILSSNPRLLSKAGYQCLFAALCFDAKTNSDSEYKLPARILLLAILTALPVKTLLTPGYIGHPKFFSVGVKRAYIKHRLGITKGAEGFDSTKHESKSDQVKLPIPLWLIESFVSFQMPTNQNFIDYLAMLRASLGLPYLSLNRIETALHVILTRYTPGSHSHIADIICRTPASHAPAVYYSSHHSKEIIQHYKAAIEVLNKNETLDISYITVWHNYTVGSRFAYTPQYVREVIKEFRRWLANSLDAEEHFNRTSIFVWFAFCLLTGVRPNNDIGKVAEIDIDTGWLIVNDKPNKATQNQRLVPLCTTLTRYLSSYKNYLLAYQFRNIENPTIEACIDKVRFGDDVTLVAILSDEADTLKSVKRGDAYRMTKHIIDADPYWTRHFVRTQLEKHGVDLALINSVMGHEKARQEVLGNFSSQSKAALKNVSKSFESIAECLELTVPSGDPLNSFGGTDNANQ